MEACGWLCDHDTNSRKLSSRRVLVEEMTLLLSRTVFAFRQIGDLHHRVGLSRRSSSTRDICIHGRASRYYSVPLPVYQRFEQLLSVATLKRGTVSDCRI